MRKMIFSLFVLFTFLSFFKSQINGYEYWFDRDVGNKISYTLSSPSDNLIVNQNIPTNSLIKGLHQFNFRSWDVSNKFSGVITNFFYKISINPSSDKNIVGYQYCLDRDFDNGVLENVTPIKNLQVNRSIDVNSLNDGLHVISFRFLDDKNQWSSITTDFFYKISKNDIILKNIVGYQYCLDRDFEHAVTENVSPTQVLDVNKIINLSTLKDGLHNISFRFLDDKGNYSAITTDFFYKISKNDVITKNIVEYQYWIDKHDAEVITQSISPVTILDINKSIDLNAIKDGIHVFNVRLKDDQGNWSSIATQFFTKKGKNLSPKNIVGYEYWFNEDYANVVKKDVTATSVFALNSIILPGTLTTRYNVLNFRFKDSSGEWSSVLSETFQEITLATVENTLKDVVFYPNPFEENLNINLGKNYHKIEVEVFDGSGRKVYQNNFMNKNTVQLQLKLSSGVYQLILKADEKVTSRKILRR